MNECINNNDLFKLITSHFPFFTLRHISYVLYNMR